MFSQIIPIIVFVIVWVVIAVVIDWIWNIKLEDPPDGLNDEGDLQ